MIGSYKFTREEIVNKIRRCPKTKDGYYVCKKFIYWNMSNGEKLEKDYLSPRDYFRIKICFDELDIKRYTTKSNFDGNVNLMIRRDEFLHDVIIKDLKYPLRKKFPGKKFSLSDLIDSTIFYFNYKYA